MMVRFACLAVAAWVALSFSTRAAEIDPAIVRIQKDLFYLAGEECNGRGVGTEGIDRAAAHIAKSFEASGLQPAMKDGYFQPFTIATRPRLGSPNKIVVTHGETAIELKYGDDFTPAGLSGSGKVTGDAVFVGYGISAPKLKYDDYAGIDVKGKIVVMLRKTPKADEKDNPFVGEELEALASLTSKVEAAIAKGAIAVVLVNDKTFAKKEDALMDLRRFGADAAKIPVVQIKRATLEKMFGDKKLTDIEAVIDKELKPKSVALTGWNFGMEVTLTRPEIACKNVVGFLPGSGPLADETIVLGAHYDHLGIESEGSLGGAAAKGKVHFGADDNASGTTGLLELAQRFGKMKSRYGRRIVFIAFSAEERGLYGSKFYANNPIFPIEKTVFMLNMDMIGRSKAIDDGGTQKNRLIASGTGAGEGFEKLVDAANAGFDFKMYKTPTGGGPSDHASFYSKKVPILFFHTGSHKDYHRPSDTPDKIDLPVMKKVIDYLEGISAYFAVTPERPKYLLTKSRWSDPTEDKPQGSSLGKMPRLGVMPGDYAEEEKGVLVDDVSPGGAAEAAGVKGGDVIVMIAGKPIRNIEDYMKTMTAQKVGQEIEVVVLRKDKKITLKATPKE